MFRRISAVFCAGALLVGALGSARAAEGGGDVLRCAVLYAGMDESWRDAYSHLDQSLLLNLTVEGVDVSAGYALEGYDVVYPDPSVMDVPDAQGLRQAMTDYVEKGGALFLDNSFYDFLPAEVIGAAEFVKLDHCPVDVTSAAGGDLDELGQLITDFAGLYPDYTDYARLSGYDYGYALRPDTAQTVAAEGDLALYTMNRYGEGWVFFTNPLLPNVYSVNGFSMESRRGEQVSSANTTTSANQLIRNAFAGFISKRKFGYAPYRVFGVLGRPSMSWELHVEDITGMAQGTMVPFMELCREAGQIPSYSLIRNTYYWLSRQESVTYALNQAPAGEEMAFRMDLWENAYSSGTHISVGGDDWVRLGDVEDAGSYFMDYPQFDQRAYPWIGDLTGDGTADLVSGAADGCFYFFPGLGYTGRFAVGEKQGLTDEAGTALSVPGYSAPVLWDVDGDGTLDLVSGAADGKLYWFSGLGGTVFRPMGELLSTGEATQTLPDIGDWDGDGNADLLVGTNAGKLWLYRGSHPEGLKVSPAPRRDLSPVFDEVEGTWLAPRMADLNGDGRPDLVVGTFHGYVVRAIRQENGSLELDGCFTAQEPNYKGNYNLKLGNNCVPFFYDLNGDGALDLAAGCLEYGVACPIDAGEFPHRGTLQAAVDQVRAAGSYVGLHYYTNVHASREREDYELKAHKAALERYGIPTEHMGANQHTWHLSGDSLRQSFDAMWDAGLLWNSGYEPPRSAIVPQVAAENAIALPFFLEENGTRTLLLQNNSTLTYAVKPWDEISARYGMPMCVYYHCDWLFREDIRAEAERNIAQVGNFQRTYQYNFVREDQMMAATAAAYNLTLTCAGGGGRLTLTPGARGTDFPLYDEDYQNACGVRLSFAQGVDLSQVATDADVWCWVGEDLCLGLNRPVTVDLTGNMNTDSHLDRVNIPAVITKNEDGTVDLAFREGGMMQAAVTGMVKVCSPGWRTERQGEQTILTKYGPAETLRLAY